MKIVFSLLIGLSVYAHGLTSEEVRLIETSLGARTTPIIKAFDDQSIVYLKTELEKIAPQAAVIPFLSLQSPSSSTQDSFLIKKIDIVVLSKRTKFPEAVLAVLNDMASVIEAPVTFRISPLPIELQKIPSVPSERRIVKVLRDKAAIPVALITGFCLISLLFATILPWAKRQAKAVESGFEQVILALEEGGQTSKSNPALGILQNHSTAALLAELPENGLIALFTDCYWSQCDSYAAYLWKLLPVANRRLLLNKVDFLYDYVFRLADISPINLAVEHEPFYLSPPAISHLDNEALTKFVKKDPSLLFKLSSLRRSGLALSRDERLAITRLALARPTTTLPDFKHLPTSSLRSISLPMKIEIKDINEEKELLKLEHPSVELMENVPSLGWWSRLPQEELRETLKLFSPKELATAWIGPEEVLGKFKKLLPKKKYYFLGIYLNRITPSRSSNAFKSLHLRAVTLLKGEKANNQPCAPKGEVKPTHTAAPQSKVA